VGGLTLDNVSLDAMVLSVRGKTAKALDRYITSFRPRHYAAHKTDALWLGRDGAMTPDGIAQAVKNRRPTSWP
jgi:hypothetical protein